MGWVKITKSCSFSVLCHCHLTISVSQEMLKKTLTFGFTGHEQQSCVCPSIPTSSLCQLFALYSTLADFFICFCNNCCFCIGISDCTVYFLRNCQVSQVLPGILKSDHRTSVATLSSMANMLERLDPFKMIDIYHVLCY